MRTGEGKLRRLTNEERAQTKGNNLMLARVRAPSEGGRRGWGAGAARRRPHLHRACALRGTGARHYARRP